MKILWLDINSSYSHSSVALPAIHAQVMDREDWEWSVVRGTINDNPGTLAAEVAQHEPDVIAATFWLFTHRMQIEVLSRTMQLCNRVKVICGGPEFLGDNKDFLRRHPFITAVIRGEGEAACPALLDSIYDMSAWPGIGGLCWISPEDGAYHDNGTARVDDFASLRYPEESPFFNWNKPFVQLETARGCFNTCAFCVSGGDKPIRYQSLEQIRTRLDNICAHGISDIRVLDRTFNYDQTRAGEMLSLFRRYADKMHFHLEIHPSLISPRLKKGIMDFPEGVLHLEAGIQSLDDNVLSESGRHGNVIHSLDGLQFLCMQNNIQTHADLIAGLPCYSLDMLRSDIITLMKTGVDELQIESLKVLPGTILQKDAQKKGLIYSPLPPYEILQTPHMSVSDLRTAMQISRTVDLYYNAPAWQALTRTLVSADPEFISTFTSYLSACMVLDSPVSLERRGIILYEYCKIHYPDMVDQVSIAWVKAGFSLKKAPAGHIIKVKHINDFLDGTGGNLSIEYGTPDPSYRYYLMVCSQYKILFGYSSEEHCNHPVFMAMVRL